MRRNPDISRRGLAAPQALAVLSCALALMIAHPAAARADAVGSPSVVESSTGAALETVHLQDRLGKEASSPSKRAPSRAFFSSARRLHILATVEILHRMLMSELRPAPVRSLCGGTLDLAFAPLCWFPQPESVVRAAHPERVAEATLLRERECVLVRSQLAPPAV